MNMAIFFLKNRRYFIKVSFFFCMSVLLIWCLSKYNSSIINPLTCYTIEKEDILPAAESSRFQPKPNSIFFHETSCNGNLNPRQACSIESAAKAHPHRQIHVLFNSPVNKDVFNNEIFKHLKNTYEVTFARVHLTNYARNTPMEKMISSGALNFSLYPVTHASDALRFLTLYKWSGIYLDLDMIVMKPLDTLAEDFAAKEEPTVIGSSVLALSSSSAGRTLAEIIARDLGTNFRGDVWGHNGPFAITRALLTFCRVANVTELSETSCKGFKVYNESLFSSIGWRHKQLFFEDVDIPKNNAYGYHVWNQMTKDTNAANNSLYSKLAKKYCPKMYQLYTREFNSEARGS